MQMKLTCWNCSIMEISNFSSLIEVGVALNIACVAIEYVKSYTNVLCNQVFNLKYQIEKAAKECFDKLNEVMDDTTLRNLPNTNVGGRNTEVLKQRLIRNRETLSSDITSKKDNLSNVIKNVCEVKNVSSICLWLFLFGLVGLFVIGFESGNSIDNNWIHLYWVLLTILGSIICIIGWRRSEEERSWWKFDYTSLRFSILSFVVSAIVCASLTFIFSTDIVIKNANFVWNTILVYSMVLMYSNFIVSAIEVWNKAKKGKGDIESEKQALLNRCVNWNNEVSHLQGALHVDEDLAANDINNNH